MTIVGIPNRAYGEQKNFIKSCLSYNVKPTKRQASKFRNGKGSLFKKQRPSIPYFPSMAN